MSQKGERGETGKPIGNEETRKNGEMRARIVHVREMRARMVHVRGK